MTGFSEIILVSFLDAEVTLTFSALDLRLPSRRSSPSPFRSIPRNLEGIRDVPPTAEEEEEQHLLEDDEKFSKRGPSTTLKRSHTDDGYHARPLDDSCVDNSKTTPTSPVLKPHSGGSAKNAKMLLDLPSAPRNSKQAYGASPTRQSRWGWKHRKSEKDTEDSESSSRGTSTSADGSKRKRRSSVNSTTSNAKTPISVLPNRDGAIQEQMTTRKKIEAGILGWLRYRVRFLKWKYYLIIIIIM